MAWTVNTRLDLEPIIPKEESLYVEGYCNYIRNIGKRPVIVFGSFDIWYLMDVNAIYEKLFHKDGRVYNSIADSRSFIEYTLSISKEIEYTDWTKTAKEFIQYCDNILFFLDRLHFNRAVEFKNGIRTAPLTFYELRYIIEHGFLSKTIFIYNDEEVTLTQEQIDYTLHITQDKMALYD